MNVSQIVVGAVTGIVVAVSSAIVSHILIARRERERAIMEDRRQREAWDREMQAQNRADRLRVYREFLADIGRISLSSEEGRTAWNRAEDTLPELAFFGSDELRRRAIELFSLSTEAAELGLRIQNHWDSEHRWDTEAYESAEEKRKELVKVREKWLEERDEVSKLMREELGLETSLSISNMAKDSN